MFQWIKNLFLKRPNYNQCCFTAENTEGNKMRVCQNKIVSSRPPTKNDWNYKPGTEWIHDNKKYVLSQDWMLCMKKVKPEPKKKVRKKEVGKTRLLNKRFGMLKVVDWLSRRDKAGSPRDFWVCECDCGKSTEVRTSDLERGYTNSCGCGAYPSLNNLAKLNWRKVDTIRSHQNFDSDYTLSRRFGVTCATIRNVLTMRTWTPENQRTHELQVNAGIAA